MPRAQSLAAQVADRPVEEGAVPAVPVEDEPEAAAPEEPSPADVPAGEPAPDEEPLQLLDPVELRGGLEALLFVMDNPVDAETLAAALRCPVDQVQNGLAELAEEYRSRRAGIALRRVGEGWRLYTSDEHAAVVERYRMLGAGDPRARRVFLYRHTSPLDPHPPEHGDAEPTRDPSRPVTLSSDNEP